MPRKTFEIFSVDKFLLTQLNPASYEMLLVPHEMLLEPHEMLLEPQVSRLITTKSGSSSIGSLRSSFFSTASENLARNILALRVT